MEMNKVKKIVFSLSLFFVIVCFGVSIWLATVLDDTTSYAMATFFGVAVIWFGINVNNIFKEKQ